MEVVVGIWRGHFLYYPILNSKPFRKEEWALIPALKAPRGERTMASMEGDGQWGQATVCL